MQPVPDLFYMRKLRPWNSFLRDSPPIPSHWQRAVKFSTFPLCHVVTAKFKCACHLNKQIKGSIPPRPPTLRKANKNQQTHSSDPRHRTAGRPRGPTKGSAAPLQAVQHPPHWPSSRSRRWTSALRQSAPRAQTAAQPHCSQTGYKPCASAATRGTPTGSPTSRRWPLPSSKGTLSFSQFGVQSFRFNMLLKPNSPVMYSPISEWTGKKSSVYFSLIMYIPFIYSSQPTLNLCLE